MVPVRDNQIKDTHMLVTGAKNLGISTVNHVLTKAISLIRILSSKVARKAPSGVLRPFLIWPLIPETVRMAAPSNLATSKELVNIPKKNWKKLNNRYSYYCKTLFWGMTTFHFSE